MNRHRAKMKMNSKLHVIARAFIRLCQMPSNGATISHPHNFTDPFLYLTPCTHAYTHSHSKYLTIFFPHSVDILFYICTTDSLFTPRAFPGKNEKVTVIERKKENINRGSHPKQI